MEHFVGKLRCESWYGRVRMCVEQFVVDVHVLSVVRCRRVEFVDV